MILNLKFIRGGVRKSEPRSLNFDWRINFREEGDGLQDTLFGETEESSSGFSSSSIVLQRVNS